MTAVELYEWASSDGGPADVKQAVRDLVVANLSTTLAYQLAEAAAKDMTTAAAHWKAKYEGAVVTGQEVADLRRTVRRLVEAASGEALEDARVVLEGHAVEQGEPDLFEPQLRGWCESSGAVFTAIAMDAPGGPLTVTTIIPPTLAELAAARPRVTVPGRYCGPDCYGVRIGRLVEDRDGVAQVQVAGYGVLNVPSAEVER